jgi:hypothetical protein
LTFPSFATFQAADYFCMKYFLFALADAYGCKIASNYDGTYTCTPHNSSRHYEVHVLAVYEVTNRRSEEVGDMRVDIIHRGKSDNRRLVLVLVSYESVNWILNIPPEITINEVILVSTEYG